MSEVHSNDIELKLTKNEMDNENNPIPESSSEEKQDHSKEFWFSKLLVDKPLIILIGVFHVILILIGIKIINVK